MQLSTLLHICPGVTAIIGSGGKTTLLYALAEELKTAGSVIVCTTTHIFPPDHIPCLYSPTREQVAQALAQAPVVCAAARCEQGKVTAPELPMAVLAELADFVLVEADGSRRLPLKAHAGHEPVVPQEANQIIAVLGLSGLGRPLEAAAHRPELYAQKTGAALTDPVTPELAARLLNTEQLHTRVFLNQADEEAGQALGRELASHLTTPVVMGSLRKGEAVCLY